MHQLCSKIGHAINSLIPGPKTLHCYTHKQTGDCYLAKSGMHAKNYSNKAGMMLESKGHVLAKPHGYIFDSTVISSTADSN